MQSARANRVRVSQKVLMCLTGRTLLPNSRVNMRLCLHTIRPEMHSQYAAILTRKPELGLLHKQASKC